MMRCLYCSTVSGDNSHEGGPVALCYSGGAHPRGPSRLWLGAVRGKCRGRSTQRRSQRGARKKSPFCMQTAINLVRFEVSLVLHRSAIEPASWALYPRNGFRRRDIFAYLLLRIPHQASDPYQYQYATQSFYFDNAVQVIGGRLKPDLNNLCAIGPPM